eukprot:GHVQ01001353.1.p1 GENE.GHVQ01001353.1~~GHVQ01001353.1.p1  ORF type:complete len:920 (-),score=211.95 GHVQ01001353.1:192-2951(-)
MGIFSRVSEQYQELWKAIIRPPRDRYKMEDLGPSVFPLPVGPRKRRMFQRRDNVLVNRRGLNLACSHFEPIDDQRKSEKLPVVIYMHGNCSSRMEALVCLQLLLPLNITVFAFDFSGSGQSGGEYVSLGWYERDDLAVVVEHLRASGRTSCIGLWGRSMGAVTALLHGDRDPSIAAMVLDSPFSNLRKLAEELVDVYVSWRLPKFLVSTAMSMLRQTIQNRAHFDIDHLSPIDHVDKSFIPAMFIGAKDDKFILPHHARELALKYAGDSILKAVEGDHNSVRPVELQDGIGMFFHQTLQCDSLEPDRLTIETLWPMTFSVITDSQKGRRKRMVADQSSQPDQQDKQSSTTSTHPPPSSSETVATTTPERSQPRHPTRSPTLSRYYRKAASALTPHSHCRTPSPTLTPPRTASSTNITSPPLPPRVSEYVKDSVESSHKQGGDIRGDRGKSNMSTRPRDRGTVEQYKRGEDRGLDVLEIQDTHILSEGGDLVRGGGEEEHKVIQGDENSSSSGSASEVQTPPDTGRSKEVRRVRDRDDRGMRGQGEEREDERKGGDDTKREETEMNETDMINKDDRVGGPREGEAVEGESGEEERYLCWRQREHQGKHIGGGTHAGYHGDNTSDPGRLRKADDMRPPDPACFFREDQDGNVRLVEAWSDEDDDSDEEEARLQRAIRRSLIDYAAEQAARDTTPTCISDTQTAATSQPDSRTSRGCAEGKATTSIYGGTDTTYYANSSNSHGTPVKDGAETVEDNHTRQQQEGRDEDRETKTIWLSDKAADGGGSRSSYVKNSNSSSRSNGRSASSSRSGGEMIGSLVEEERRRAYSYSNSSNSCTSLSSNSSSSHRSSSHSKSSISGNSSSNHRSSSNSRTNDTGSRTASSNSSSRDNSNCSRRNNSNSTSSDSSGSCNSNSSSSRSSRC